MKYLKTDYLDDEWSVTGNEEDRFRSFIKEVAETTYTKVISPENFLIYSLLGFHRKKDEAFRVITIEPDSASLGIMLLNSKGCYFSDKNHNIGYITFETLKENGVTDTQIQEIEEAGFFLQYRTEKKALTLLPSKMLLATLCRQLGIGKLNSGPEPLRDIYLASQMSRRKKFKIVYRKYQGKAKAFACFGLKYHAEPQTIVLKIIDHLRMCGAFENIKVHRWKICHSSTTVELVFPSMQLKLNDINILPGVRLTTSDIGDSSYTLENILCINEHTIILKDSIAKKHTSELDVESFVEQYKKNVFPGLILIMTRIKNLETIKVSSKKIALSSLLTKAKFNQVIGTKNMAKFKKRLEQLTDKECSGMDVVLELLSIPGYLHDLGIEPTERSTKAIGMILSFDLIGELRTC